MTLTAAGPAGTVHDPFAGTVPDDGAELSFPAERYAAVGASEQDVEDLSAYFDSLTRQEQRDALAWHDARDDEQLAESLAAFRQARDAFAGLGGLTDEQRAELEALSDEERAVLAELAAADKQTDEDEQAAYDALSDDEKAALAALTPEQLAELRPEPVADGAEPAAEPSADAAGTADAGQPDSGAQTGAETAFTTKQIADLTFAVVDALIERGDLTAEQALTAELARGDKARKQLVEKLTAATQTG